VYGVLAGMSQEFVLVCSRSIRTLIVRATADAGDV
jgi:hypothetical protein